MVAVGPRTRSSPFLAATAFVLIVCDPLRAQTSIPAQELQNVFPAESRVREFRLTADGGRTYYVTTSGELWLYDRDRGTNTPLTLSGSVWDLSLSPRRDALVYTKAGESRRGQHIWLLPLDPATGLAAAAERRLSPRPGDVPSISPDGRTVAFARDDTTGVGQSVVLVPIGGGAERVVAAAQPSGLGHIRWTPDGQTLYFGVNPPVPFTCAESCLTLPGGNQQVPGTIRRVSAAGGPVVVVATTGNPNPGLSPDGTLLAHVDSDGSGRLVVADLDGRRLDALPIAPAQVPQGWSGGSTLLTMATGAVRRLYLTTLPDGASRRLFEIRQFIWTPTFSPDGESVLLGGRDGAGCAFRIVNLDGSLETTIPMRAGECAFEPEWAADQSWFAYTRYAESGPPGIRAIEPGTGRVTELRPPSPDDMAWVLDGDVVVASGLSGGSAQRRVSFWQVGLDGRTRLLRELPMDPPPTWVTPLDRTTALTQRDEPNEALLVRLDSAGGDRQLRPAQPGFFKASVSRDKRWVAFLINPSGSARGGVNVVELARLDGTVRHTMELPFFANDRIPPAILRGGDKLVLAERPDPGKEGGIHLVDVAARSVRKLFDYAPVGRLPELEVSPDGMAVLVLISQAVPPVVSAMDLSRVR